METPGCARGCWAHPHLPRLEPWEVTGLNRASGLSSCHLTLGVFSRLCSCGCGPERHSPGPEEGHPEIRAAQAGAGGRHSAHQLVSGASAPPSALPGRWGGRARHERAFSSPGLCSGCNLEHRAPCPEPLKRAGAPVPPGPAPTAPPLHYHTGSWVAAHEDTLGRAQCVWTWLPWLEELLPAPRLSALSLLNHPACGLLNSHL